MEHESQGQSNDPFAPHQDQQSRVSPLDGYQLAPATNAGTPDQPPPQFVADPAHQSGLDHPQVDRGHQQADPLEVVLDQQAHGHQQAAHGHQQAQLVADHDQQVHAHQQGQIAVDHDRLLDQDRLPDLDPQQAQAAADHDHQQGQLAADHARQQAQPPDHRQALGLQRDHDDQRDPATGAGVATIAMTADNRATKYPVTIAMDGPAGAGKSTIGRMLAERLGYLFFDTGAMYRAITWAALDSGVPLNDEYTLATMADELPLRIRQPLGAELEDGRAYTVIVRGQDVTHAIRRPDVETNVSQISAHKGVREALVKQQRRVAEAVGADDGSRGIVMAGRDIGTVVLHDADLKIYLDASAAERARRRTAEMEARGQECDFAQTLADIERRDLLDSTRATSPLRMADDAVRVVTDGQSIEQTMAEVMRAVTGNT